MSFWLGAVQAGGDAIYRQSVQAPLDTVYQQVYQSLEEKRFFVVFEANLGRTMANFAERWGDDYNRSKLDGMRSLVFCNIWYTNQISGADPDMLGLCPLSLSLYHKDGMTTVVFVRPTAVAADSPALPVLRELEADIIKAVQAGIGQ